MRFGLGHVGVLYQTALCPADQPQLPDLVLQAGVLLPQTLQAVVAGSCHVHGLQKQRGGEWFAQQQHPLLVQGGKQLLSLCGLYQKDHTGISLLHSGDAQFVPELIGQGSVDHDQLKIRFRHSAPRLGSTGNDHRAAVTHLGQSRGDILVGVGTGAYDQCASHSALLSPALAGIRWR